MRAPDVARRPGSQGARRACRVDEATKLRVGDRETVDPESVDRDTVDRRLLRIVPIGPHGEDASGNPDHAL